MRPSRIAVFLFFLACGASAAWAQYGLYGSPDMLRLPQPAAAQDSSVPQTYPSTANPAPDYQPASGYQPRPSYPSTAADRAAPAYQASTAGYPQQNVYPPMADRDVYGPGPLAAPTAGQYQGGDYQSMRPADGMANPMPDGQAGCPSGACGSGGPYHGAVEGYQRAAQGGCAEGPTLCQPGACCQWYASTYALVMNRNEGRSMWMSYNSNSLPTQGNNTQFGLDSGWGGEVEVGHRFCWNCVPCAVELTYWTTTDLTGSNSASYPGNSVNTLLGTDYITFHLPTGDYPANNWFYGAAEQTLSRQDEFQNLEINLVRDQLACACGSPWDIGWSAGIRYFRFQDKLTYDSFMPGAAAGTVGEASLSDNICNNLVGVQVGFDAAYNFGNGLRLFIKPQVGIYDNILDGNFQCQLGDGTEGYTTPYYNQYYPVHGSRDAIAFLTQIDVGAEWQFSRNWSARAGYRVVAATGIGFAEDQFPPYVCDVPQLSRPDNPSCLVLHGAFVGLTYCF